MWSSVNAVVVCWEAGKDRAANRESFLFCKALIGHIKKTVCNCPMTSSNVVYMYSYLNNIIYDENSFVEFRLANLMQIYQFAGIAFLLVPEFITMLVVRSTECFI